MQNDTPSVEFIESPEFWWPVTARLPIDDGGHRDVTFRVRFILADDNALLSRPEEETETAFVEHQRQLLSTHMTDVDGLTHNYPTTEALIARLLELTPYRQAIQNAFLDAHTGGKARAGN